MSFQFAGQYGPDGATNPSGQLLDNSTFVVYETGTVTLASLYTDRTKAGALANPATTVIGNILFFADPGTYDVLCNGVTLTVTVAPDPAEIIPPFNFDVDPTLPTFGAKPDSGVTDNALAVNAVMAYAVSQGFTGCAIRFPPAGAGAYGYASTIVIPNGFNLDLDLGLPHVGVHTAPPGLAFLKLGTSAASWNVPGAFVRTSGGTILGSTTPGTCFLDTSALTKFAEGRFVIRDTLFQENLCGTFWVTFPDSMYYWTAENIRGFRHSGMFDVGYAADGIIWNMRASGQNNNPTLRIVAGSSMVIGGDSEIQYTDGTGDDPDILFRSPGGGKLGALARITNLKHGPEQNGQEPPGRAKIAFWNPAGNQVPFVNSVKYAGNNAFSSQTPFVTSIAAGSDTVPLIGAGTISVAATAFNATILGVPTVVPIARRGVAKVTTDTGTWDVSYTGITGGVSGGTITGCTTLSGTGTMSLGGAVSFGPLFADFQQNFQGLIVAENTLSHFATLFNNVSPNQNPDSIFDPLHNVIINSQPHFSVHAQGSASFLQKIVRVTATGTTKVPAGVTQARVKVQGNGGAGGGGGTSTATNAQVGGGGGGAGAFIDVVITVVPADTLTITIPAAATGGTFAAANGNPGGQGGTPVATTVTGTGVSLSVPGGGGGLPGLANSTATASGGSWGGGLRTASSSVLGPAQGGSSLTTNGVAGGSPVGPAGGGGGSGGPSSATNGGGAGGAGTGAIGGAAGGTATSGTVDGATGEDAPAGTGAGGGGGGAGAKATGVSGAGGKGATGYVLIEWL